MKEKIKELKSDIAELEMVLKYMRKEEKVFTFKAYRVLYQQVKAWKFELAEIECKHEIDLLNQIISN